MTDTPNFCSGCGFKVAPEDRFCSSCGNQIRGVLTAASSATEIEYKFALKKCDDDDINWLISTSLQNQSIAIELLERFTSSENELTREAIAGNLTSPTKLLSKLSKDEDDGVRYCVALNPNTPAKLLTLLLDDDDDEGVLVGLAQNVALPGALQMKLWALAITSSVGDSILWHLSANPGIVAEVGMKVAQMEDLVTIKRLAENPAAPTKLLVNCLESDSDELRYLASSNASTPISALQHGSQDLFVRKGVSKNAQTPSPILETLAADPECHADLASNPNVPAPILEELFNNANTEDAELVNFHLACNPSTPGYVLQRLLTRDKYLRQWVAQNSSLAAAQIEQISASKIPSDRAAVAKNPSISLDVLDELAIDEEMDVCLSVVRNPRFAPRLNLFLKQLHDYKNWDWPGV